MRTMHPLDQALLGVPANTSTHDLLEIVWRTYEVATGLTVSRPPTSVERSAVEQWARNPGPQYSYPILARRESRLTHLLHLTMANKASHVNQLSCSIHHPDDPSGGPVVTFPIGIEPWSAQSSADKVSIRRRVSETLIGRGFGLLPFGDDAICMNITSLVSMDRRRKDVDNLAKGVLDAMQGYLYEDDGQIECLTLRRMTFSGSPGHYLVRAASVRPNDADVIFDSSTPPTLLSGKVG